MNLATDILTNVKVNSVFSLLEMVDYMNNTTDNMQYFFIKVWKGF